MARNGLITRKSAHDMEVTTKRLVAALQARGISLVATVDHAKSAASAGLQLRPTTLLIFGNPKGGTPLMQAAQTAGIDLPLKALIWQDEKGAVNVSYNNPVWVAARHAAKAPQAVEGLSATLATLAEQAAN
jgi:uncharacterized protein (DUF302 family)